MAIEDFNSGGFGSALDPFGLFHDDEPDEQPTGGAGVFDFLSTGAEQVGETVRANVAQGAETVRAVVGQPAAIADSAADAAVAPFDVLKWGAAGLAAVVVADLAFTGGQNLGKVLP